MQLILFVIILICFVISFFCFLNSFTLRNPMEIKYSIIWLIPALILSFWIFLSCIQYEWIIKEYYLQAHLVNQVPVTSINGRIINLDHYFSENIDEGQSIICKETISGWYGGIYWIVLPEDRYEFILEG